MFVNVDGNAGHEAGGVDDWCDYEDYDDGFSVEPFVRPGPVVDPLAAPGAGLAEQCHAAAVVPSLLDTGEVLDVVEGIDRVARWAAAVRIRMLAEFADRHPAGSDAPRAGGDVASPVDRWVPDEVGMTLRIARLEALAEIAKARRFVHVLPDTLALLEAGRIDERRADAVASATALLPDDKAREVEARVLAKAPEATVKQLRERLRRAVARVDPEGAYRRHREAVRERSVSIRSLEDGMASLWFYGPAEEIEAAWTMADRLARVPRDPGDERTLDQRRFDLAVQVLQGRLTVTDMGDVERAVDAALDAVAAVDAASAGTGPAAADSAGADSCSADPGSGGSCSADPGSAGSCSAGSADAGCDPTAADGAGTDGAGTDGAGTDGAGTDGAGTDGAGTDGAGNDDTTRWTGDATTTGSALSAGRTPRVGDAGSTGAIRADADASLDDTAGPPGGRPDRRGPGIDRAVLTAVVAQVLAAQPPLHATILKPQIQVVVALDTLLGSDRSAELIGHGPIDAVTARALAAGGVWARLVTDRLSGRLLDYGRDVYSPPADLADFVRARDQVCRGPGCTRKIAELDHHVPFGGGHDGTTSEANLDGYCKQCHLLKDAPGWNVLAEGEDRTLTWISPHGRRTVTAPYDYRAFTDPLPHRPVTASAGGSTGAAAAVPTPDGDDAPPF